MEQITQNSRETAWNFLLENGIDSLPLDPLKVLARYGIELLTYDGLAWITNENIETLSAKFGGGAYETFAFISSEGRRMIVYDEESETERREIVTAKLGNFILGHLNETRRILRRDARYYTAYAAEAREFARRVLCPSIVIHKLGLTSAAQVSEVCGVGNALAGEVAKHMEVLLKRNRFLDSKLEQEVLDKFQGFIKNTVKEF